VRRDLALVDVLARIAGRKKATPTLAAFSHAEGGQPGT
jgi:hypothetical protein